MKKNNMKKRKDKLLATGEVTGHAHRAKGNGVAVYGEGTERLLEAPEGATVTHEEHGPQKLAPGEYDVSRVREYDPFEQAIRTVAD